MKVFFSEADYEAYRDLIFDYAQHYGVAIWAYCLLPNHVHFLAVPSSEEALSLTFGRAHWRYALRIHRREKWTGHLWQERFYSCPMDDRHLVAATQYVLQNPVRAELVSSVLDWRFSSLPCHLGLVRDPLVERDPLDRRIGSWRSLLNARPSEDAMGDIRIATRRGRPLIHGL